MPYRRKRDPRDLEEGQRLLQVLRAAMAALGVTRKQVQNRAGFSAGYLTRLFSGTFEVRLEQLLTIARAIGLEPAELFHLAYPRLPQPPSPAAAQLRRVLQGPLEPQEEACTPQDRLAQAFGLLQQGFVDLEVKMISAVAEPQKE
jgi:transcriptional regulator with XRE-family HTH domain